MGDGPVRRGRPAEGYRIVLRRSLKALGRSRRGLPGGLLGRGDVLFLGVDRQGNSQAQDRQEGDN